MKITGRACALLFTSAIASAQVTLHQFDGDDFGDLFGASVRSAGDVNQDGYDDWIVGAPLGGDLKQGAARVFSGADGAVLYAYVGDDPGDEFGWAVDGVGDVDGDGWDDFAISARFDDDNGPASGSVRVYSGRTGAPFYTLFGAASGYQFGFSVAGVGDIDGDGLDDLIVGSRYDSTVHFQGGSARVYSGLTGTEIFAFFGPAAGDLMGWSVAGAGDTNGDGRNDLIVSCHRANVNGTNSGSAYVFSGLDGSVLHQFNGSAANEEFGNGVAGVGDIDGDGFDDVIVGARFAAVGSLRPGSAFVYSGRTGAELYRFDGPSDMSEFGLGVRGAGDFDGDGVPDLIVGARLTANSSGQSGAAFVYSGADGTVLAEIQGGAAGDQLGLSVDGGGDSKADGTSQVIVGSPQSYYPPTPTGPGYALVLSACTGATAYCPPAPNSAGPGAFLTHSGSVSVAAADLVLELAGCPHGQTALFYYGQTSIRVPFGDGFRCVGGQVHRLGVVTADDAGAASKAVDYTVPPAKSTLLPGSRWHFQAWYRDPQAGMSGFNFSSALKALFCP